MGDLNAKVGSKEIFRPTIERFIVHGESNENGQRLFATSQNLTIGITLFPGKKIHKVT